MDLHTTLTNLLALTTTEVDPSAAFRAVREHFVARLPDCAFALLHVQPDSPSACRLVGLIGPDGVEHLAAVDPEARGATLPGFDDAVARACINRSEVHLVDLAPVERGTAFAQALMGPAAIVALPVDDRAPAAYWLAIGSHLRHRFDRIDLKLLEHEARLAFAILAARFRQQIVERQHREIEGLADVQRLLQPENPAIRGLEHAIHWQPAETAAGDYYDLMALSAVIDDFDDSHGDAWGVMLADVSGHGAAAAMEAVQFDAILRTYDGEEPPGGPAGALTYANRHFFSRRQRRHFMTIFSVASRPDKGGLLYVCAGHLPAIMRRADGRIERLGAGADAGIPVGILREHRWDNSETGFEIGDLVVLYTDGIVEARDARGRMFGIERLTGLVSQGEATAAATLARIREAVTAHQGAPIGGDDQTVIALRRVAL